MSSVLSFLVLLLLITVQNAFVIDDVADPSCNAVVDPLDACSATVFFPGGCKSATANLTNTEFVKCKSITFFWSYPSNNLTLIIETPFTPAHQPYTIYLDNEQLMTGVNHVYQVFNNQETEVTTRDKTLIQYSDSNYQVILKLQGPSRLNRYGVNIDYEIIKM